MELGAFSISLAVKDLDASRAFYEKLGFEAFAGNPAQKWLILTGSSAPTGAGGSDQSNQKFVIPSDREFGPDRGGRIRSIEPEVRNSV
jgi:catechol 2,3-dioxygenase-like lactoylglutathione lyase family enzyme